MTAGPPPGAHRPDGSGATARAGRAGRARRPHPLLLTLTLCMFLAVGVPILVLATMSPVRAEAGDGLSEGSVGELASNDPAGTPPAEAPGPASWDTEAAALQQLRSGLEAPEPAQPQAQGSASDHPAGNTLLTTTSLEGTQPTAPATPDRQDRGGVPLITPNLGHLREPDRDDQLLAQAPDDGRGDGDPPRTGQAGGSWKVHIAGLEGLTDHPARDPSSSPGPGRPDQTPAASQRHLTRATVPHQDTGQPGPTTSNPQPDQAADPASLVITTPDPGDPAWLQLAASSTGAIGQPPATALVVQLPAHPQPTSGRRPGASNAQAPQPQQAHAISTGPSKPASDWLLPGLPRATVVLTAAPIPAGSLATGTQAVPYVTASASVHPSTPLVAEQLLVLNPADSAAAPDPGALDLPSRQPTPRNSEPAAPARARWHTPATLLGWLGTPVVGPVMASSADGDGTRLHVLAAGFPGIDGRRLWPRGSPLTGFPLPDADQAWGIASALAGWTRGNWEYLVAGALAAGALALLLTGVGGPLLLGLGFGVLLHAGATIATQKLALGNVDWSRVAIAAAIGGVSGTLGVLIGVLGGWILPPLTLTVLGPLLFRSPQLLRQTDPFVRGVLGRVTSVDPGLLGRIDPLVRGAAVGGPAGLVIGASGRALRGDDPFDPGLMAFDLTMGAFQGLVAAPLGDSFPSEALSRVVWADLGRNGVSAVTHPLTGRITLQIGLQGEQLVQEFRRQVVYSLLRQPPLGHATSTLRSSSHLWRYAEEAAAEAYALRSIRSGLSNPLQAEIHGLSRWRIGAEAAGAAAAGGVISYGLLHDRAP